MCVIYTCKTRISFVWATIIVPNLKNKSKIAFSDNKEPKSNFLLFCLLFCWTVLFYCCNFDFLLTPNLLFFFLPKVTWKPHISGCYLFRQYYSMLTQIVSISNYCKILTRLTFTEWVTQHWIWTWVKTQHVTLLAVHHGK